MTRLQTSFVLGYHGCDRDVARKAIEGELTLLRSSAKYDWLGAGIYFWEGDPQRALEWAQEKVTQGKYKHAAVLGATIDLGECLNLVSRANIDILVEAYKSYEKFQKKSGGKVPRNRPLEGRPRGDFTKRELDSAVFNHLHQSIELTPDAGIPTYDTVRGMFTEGKRVYPTAGFREHTHVQIAVRNTASILGLFYPPGMHPKDLTVL